MSPFVQLIFFFGWEGDTPATALIPCRPGFLQASCIPAGVLFEHPAAAPRGAVAAGPFT